MVGKPRKGRRFGGSSAHQKAMMGNLVASLIAAEAIVTTEAKAKAMRPVAEKIITKAKKDISNFKIRKGWPVGCKVTLRSSKMFEFLERLISIALPRTRDFRGLSYKSFDGRGNYNFGR